MTIKEAILGIINRLNSIKIPVTMLDELASPIVESIQDLKAINAAIEKAEEEKNASSPESEEPENVDPV